MIRPVTRTDLPVCLEILRTAYEPSAVAFGMTEENCPYRGRTRLPPAVLEQEFSVCRMFCFEKESVPVGFLSIEHRGDTVFIHDIAVLPKEQSAGTGSALMRQAIAFAASAGAAFIELGMVHDNIRLREWYERFGFMTVRLTRYHAVSYAVAAMRLQL